MKTLAAFLLMISITQAEQPTTTNKQTLNRVDTVGKQLVRTLVAE